jgi:hypothetical protein
VDIAGAAVDDDRIAGLDERGDALDLADAGHAERAGDDGDMAGRAALFQHEAAQLGALVFQQRRRAHGARHENGVFRQLGGMQREGRAGELMQQAVGEIVEIMQPLAQIGIGLAQQAGARVDWTRSTAASAVRPLITASRRRFSQPRS